MKPKILILLLCILVACKKSKDREPQEDSCHMQEAIEQNGNRVTINNGIWGTISLRQGDCMPVFGIKSTCSQCPIKREVRVYAYTTTQDIVGSPNQNGYENFKTPLIKSVTADDMGFYQAELPDGKYSVVIVEEGRLYAPYNDGLGGLSSVVVQQSKAKLDLVINRAVD